ncbi:2098_t:CDS:2 [Cetraspora pellucida]|uniref:2098_t:CDS:1 n=1 Tax=Cetraspora pellucida TaxID=1433469 RepID=A0A9N8W277_9GLOM|nr:2098_t:CDS:2 [Cetraspora pellucida]
MSTIYITPEELIKTGDIIQELHYVCYIHSSLQSGYICERSEQSSDIVTSAFTAITSVYQMVFDTKAKFLGLMYLGLN